MSASAHDPPPLGAAGRGGAGHGGWAAAQLEPNAVSQQCARNQRRGGHRARAKSALGHSARGGGLCRVCGARRRGGGRKKGARSHAGLSRGPYGYLPYALASGAMRPVDQWVAPNALSVAMQLHKAGHTSQRTHGGGGGGPEPRALRLLAIRSSQLSYETSRPVGGAKCLVFDNAIAQGRTHITEDPRRAAERGSMLKLKP